MNQEIRINHYLVSYPSAIIALAAVLTFNKNLRRG